MNKYILTYFRTPYRCFFETFGFLKHGIHKAERCSSKTHDQGCTLDELFLRLDDVHYRYVLPYVPFLGYVFSYY